MTFHLALDNEMAATLPHDGNAPSPGRGKPKEELPLKADVELSAFGNLEALTGKLLKVPKDELDKQESRRVKRVRRRPKDG